MKLNRHTAGYLVAAVFVVLVVLVAVLIEWPPSTGCLPEPAGGPKLVWFRATETSVRPWLGSHHVYGIFVIPERYKFDHLYSAKLIIHGFEAEFSVSSPEVGSSESVAVEPGHYTKRIYVPTRTALWLLITGRFGDLRSSCHWWLAIVDREWRPTGTVWEG